MCWVSDAIAPTPPNLSDLEDSNRPLTANDFRPPEPDDLLAELSQKSSVSEPGFSHHAQRTKAIPEGAGKRIRAERAGTAPTKPAEAHPEYYDEGMNYQPRAGSWARSERERGAVSASHTSHESTRSHGDVSCLFSCVFFQCTVAIWLGSMASVWLSRDSSLTRASWVWHSPHTLCQCLCRVRGGGGRARAPFLPPPASAQRPRLPAPRPRAGPARARVAPSAPCARAPCE